jgi:hypothetical protein
VTEGAIRDAFAATEGAFIAEVAAQFDAHPDAATVGSCCLLAVVHGRTLFVANLGDSRAVLGRKPNRGGQIVAEQLSSEHNANMEPVRQELLAEHSDDPQIVALKHGVWRVKGIIQVSLLVLLSPQWFEFMSPCLKVLCMLITRRVYLRRCRARWATPTSRTPSSTRTRSSPSSGSPSPSAGL